MREEKTKICFVIPHLSDGGAERVVSVLSSELAKQNLSVSILMYYHRENEYVISKDVEVCCLTNRNSYEGWNYFTKIRRIREALEQIKPHYIVPFLPHVALHVFFATGGRGAHFIQTVRIDPKSSLIPFPVRIIHKWLIRKSYRTFVQNNEQKAYYSKSVQKKIVVIPNPVSEDVFSYNHMARSSDVLQVISVGRLTKQKNYKMLIDAIKCVIANGYIVHLSIFGEGELKDELETLISGYGLENFCSLRGKSNCIGRELMCSDLFVMTSEREGMPNALLEAMAVGLPCISTNCRTGPSDLLADGRGILVELDDVEELSKAIEIIINNKDYAIEMGKKAQNYVREKYRSTNISKEFVEKVLSI